jgi:hypothetical protein
MNTGDDMYIYLLNGFYFGFINNGYLFSRDGICLGWLEGAFVWDLEGRFRGSIFTQDNHKYIIRRRFGLLPISRPPKGPVPPAVPLKPPENIKPVEVGVEIVDAFSL